MAEDLTAEQRMLEIEKQSKIRLERIETLLTDLATYRNELDAAQKQPPREMAPVRAAELFGQYWRDTVNRDLLYITGGSVAPNGIEYIRCLCYVHGKYFGIQAMKAQQLDGARFQRVGMVKTLWYRLNYPRPRQAPRE